MQWINLLGKRPRTHGVGAFKKRSIHWRRKGLTLCSGVLSILPASPHSFCTIPVWGTQPHGTALTQPHHQSRGPDLQSPARHWLQIQFNRFLVLLLDQDEGSPGCSPKAGGGPRCLEPHSSRTPGITGLMDDGDRVLQGPRGHQQGKEGARSGTGGARGSSAPLKDAATVEHPSSGPLSQIERCSALPG